MSTVTGLNTNPTLVRASAPARRLPGVVSVGRVETLLGPEPGAGDEEDDKDDEGDDIDDEKEEDSDGTAGACVNMPVLLIPCRISERR